MGCSPPFVKISSNYKDITLKVQKTMKIFKKCRTVNDFILQ